MFYITKYHPNALNQLEFDSKEDTIVTWSLGQTQKQNK